MNNFTTCPKCHVTHRAQLCPCKPFEVTYESESKTVYANDMETAAEEWAIAHNEQGDYSMMSQDGAVELLIREPDSGDYYKFEVTAETSIDYMVIEL